MDNIGNWYAIYQNVWAISTSFGFTHILLSISGVKSLKHEKTTT